MTDTRACSECGALIDDPADQSDASRRRFFAILRETWHNLPEPLRERWPSSEMLRKSALIGVGWCDVQTIAAGSKKAAVEVAAMAKRLDDGYAMVSIAGTVVTVFTARSQRKRACPKRTFMDITDKVYAWLNQQTGFDCESGEAGRDYRRAA